MFKNLNLFQKLVRVGAILLLCYAFIAGLLLKVPNLGPQLSQTSRNLFYHVPMWFTMYLLMSISVFHAIKYLRKNDLQNDIYSSEAAKIGILFGTMGLLTGSVWSRVTWGELLQDGDLTAWWAWDPKQTMALIAMLIYCAYFILRNSFEDELVCAKVSSIYNIFAAISLIPLTLILPRILGGLHPGGSEGSPVFNSKDMSSDFRMIFYPAIIGFMCLGLWLLNLKVRYTKIKKELD